MSDKAKLCELCEEEPATVLCSECCKCYCDGCSKMIHALSKKKGHQVETIHESVRVDAMCPFHTDNPLEMFCIDEVKLCCFGCMKEKLHEGHNVVDLSSINVDNEIFSANDIRVQFADVLKLDDELDKKIENAINEIKSENDSGKDKVHQSFALEHEKLKEEEDNTVKDYIKEHEKLNEEEAKATEGFKKHMKNLTKRKPKQLRKLKKCMRNLTKRNKQF